MTDKCFKPLYGKCTTTNEVMLKDDCALPVSPKDKAKLCQELGDHSYTYLVLYDGFCHEIVKVGQMHNILYVERSQDGTTREEWPCGTQLKFDWTESGLRELKDKVKEDDECPEKLFTGTIKNGNCTVYFEDGKAIKEKPNKHQIADACYTNPVIDMEDGCISRIGKGTSVTRYQSMCDCGMNKGQCNCKPSKW